MSNTAALSATASTRRDLILGVAARTAAVGCMALVSAGAKYMAGAGTPLLQIIFCRNAFAFIPLILFVRATVGFGALRTERPLRHLTRSAVGMIGMGFGFAAAARLPLVQAAILGFTTPLFMTLLSRLILRERADWRRWIAVVAGFVGVIIALHPSQIHKISAGLIFGLVGAMGAAGAMIAIRGMPRSESGPTIVFYFTLCCTLVGLSSLPFGWVTPSPLLFAVMVGTGISGGVGQLLLTYAARWAPLPVLAPFDYTQLIWASGIGFLVFGERPDAWLFVGAGVIAVSGLYIAWGEGLIGHRNK